jgi:hypothetical protein
MSEDTAMDTPQASEGNQYLKPNLKLHQPDLYYGDREKLETWILQFDRHFHIEGDNVVDEDKVTLASTYMRDKAEKWVLPIITRYMSQSVNDAENKALVEDWDLFKIRLREIFSPYSEVTIAEQKIQDLRQTRSAADYTTQFQQYAELVQWNDNALKRMYKQGLKPGVRAELMRTGAEITSIHSLYKEAIRLDNQIYELALEERSYGRQPVREGNQRTQHNPGRKPQPNQGRQRNPYIPRATYPSRGGYYTASGPEPMHIDNIVQGSHTPTRGKGPTDKGKIICYGCGKPGHMKRDCRSKNKVVRQLNVLRKSTPSDSEEEWEVVEKLDKEPLADATDRSIKEIEKLLQELTVHDDDVKERLGRRQQIQALFNEEIRKGRILVDSTSDTGYRLVKGKLDVSYLNERTMSPHPGNYVPGHWDTPDSEELYPTQELTADELAIHTPPASPKLVRQNAVLGQGGQQPDNTTHRCTPQDASRKSHKKAKKPRSYANDGQALVIQEEPSWIETAEEAYQQRNVIYSDDTFSSRYLRDPRNPSHGILSWTACTTTWCEIHRQEKQGSNWEPRRSPKSKKCTWQPYDCIRDICADHLFDKRTSMYFPGSTPSDCTRHVTTVNGQCSNHSWQTCLNKDCKLHFATKQANGYAEGNPFLGVRLTANSAVATLRTPKDSSDLQ